MSQQAGIFPARCDECLDLCRTPGLALGLPGSHFAIVNLLIAGEVQFYTLMGGMPGP